jgi:PKD repeat protein
VPDSAGGAVITGEPVVGQQLTFNGVATDPNGLPLMFTWDFGDGTTASGATVQHVYNTAGTFTVNLTVADAALSTMVSIPLVIFAPASGAADVPNLATILNEPPLANPLNGITIQVTFSNGGIIGLTINLDALVRSAFGVTTSFDGIGGNVGTRTGLSPTIQFINPGAFVATSTATDSGTNTVAGKGRKTIAVGNKELGLPVSYSRDPASPKIKTGKIGGKFAFSKSNAASTGASDAVTYSGSFELPEGLDLTSKPTFSFAIGNIVDQTTVDSKGKGSAGTAGFIKKLQFKYPKLTRGSTVTTAGQMATFQVTIGGANLSGKGFDTEGITGSVLPSEKSLKSIPRSIQVAVVFAGVAYDATANVSFKLATNGSSGSIGTRR